MNTPGNDSEDDVTATYRLASDAEAGPPAPATRAAILAEARAASLRRTPAANDSRYAWRAVAGLAVIGVAVLLWRQADRHVSPDLTVSSQEPGGAAAEAPIPQVAADSSVIANEAAKVEMEETRSAPAPTPATRERESNRTEEAAGDLASVAAPAAPSLERQSADAAPAAGALRQDASGHQELLQREFPEIWRGDRVAGTVWVVMDAGKVARKGVLAGADTLASVATGPGDWTVVEVITASGSSLQLAVRNVD